MRKHLLPRIFALLAILCLIATGPVKAQMVVTTGVTPTTLVNTLLGPGVYATGITMNCPALAYGTFTGGMPGIGIGSGIILTTGDPTWVPGPNLATASGSDNFAPGDAQLTALIGDPTFDACVLEFDLTATCDTIQISYVFASEEYPEFVGSSFNDVFAFFINGPGIAGVQNIALIPGTSTPVAINTVNSGSYSMYYVDNTGGVNVGYDGFTTPLLAMQPVIPCSTYHIKFAIADVFDGIYDSGVFLEEGGFRCSGSLITITASTSAAGSTTAVEGCIDAIFEIGRSGDTVSTDTIWYTLGGSATEGVDYPAMSHYIVFGPGDSLISIVVPGYPDGLPEGTESIQLIVADSLCSTVFYDTATVYITDPPVPDAGPDSSICSGDSMMIGTPGVALFTYSWTPSTGLSSTTVPQPNVAMLVTGAPFSIDYYLTATDTFGCSGTDTVTITFTEPPTSTFNLTDTACFGNPVNIVYSGTASGAAVFNWTYTGSPVIVGSPTNFVATWPTSGLQIVTLFVDDGGCISPVTTDSIFIAPLPDVTINPVANQCLAGNSFDFTLSGTYDPGATIVWQFGPDATPIGALGPNPTGITFATAGVKTAIVNAAQYGCVGEADTITFTVFPMPLATWSSPTGIQCFAGNAYDFEAVYVSPTASYDWSFTDGSPSAATGSNPTGINFLSCGPKSVTLTVTENGCPATYTDTITVFCDPLVDAGLPVAFCEGEGGAQLAGTAFGGTPIYYWTWWCATPPCGIDSVFDDDPWVNPDASGYYYVQVTDFNGCQSNVDSVWITVIPKPIVDAGPDIWICGAPAPCEMLNPTVSGSPGPFTYLWSPAVGLSNALIANPCARPDTTTIYTLVVTDLTTGCTSEASTTDTLSSMTVHVNPVPVADAGPDRDLCLGDTLMLLGLGYGAGPTYTYEWSPFTPPVSLSANNIPNPLAFPDITTNYVLTVWSNGCPSYGDTVVVNVHTNPTVDAGADRDICQGESVLIDANAWGDLTSLFYNFSWTPAGTLDDATLEDPTATPHTSTMYYVIATSAYGCDSPIDSVLVQVKSTPIADAGPPITICNGDSVLIPAGYSYDGTPPADPTTVWPAWTPAVNIDDTTLLQPTVWPTSSGFYYVTITHNTCTTTDSVLIVVSPGIQVTVTADTSVICEGQSVQLNAAGGLGGASITWTPADGLSDPTSFNPIASPDTTTTYTATLDEGGCSGNTEVTVNVIPTPEMGYFSTQTTGCAPLTVSFMQDVKDALSYTWNFGDGSPVSNELSPLHIYELPGTYVVTLTATNFGGCEASISSIIIRVSDPGAAEFTSNPGFPVDMSLPNTEVHFIDMSLNAVKWVWNFGDGGYSGEINPTYTWTQEGVYEVTLTVTTADGCISQVVHGPFVIKSPDLAIPNVFSPNDDGINDNWFVMYSGSQPFTAQIYDRWGGKYYESKNKTQGWDGRDLQGAAVPEGVYYYRVVVGDKEYAGDVTLIR